MLRASLNNCPKLFKLSHAHSMQSSLLLGHSSVYNYSTTPTSTSTTPTSTSTTSTSASTTSTPTPPSALHVNPLHGSYHWYFERFVAINTLGLVTAMVALPETHSIVDMGLNLFLPLHCHLGLGCIITDYLPRRKFSTLYPILRVVLISGTLLTFYGIYQFNTNDIGVSALVRKLWTTEKKDE